MGLKKKKSLEYDISLQKTTKFPQKTAFPPICFFPKIMRYTFTLPSQNRLLYFLSALIIYRSSLKKCFKISMLKKIFFCVKKRFFDFFRRSFYRHFRVFFCSQKLDSEKKHSVNKLLHENLCCLQILEI